MVLVSGGLFLLALGLFAGAVLVLVPFGLVAWRADATLWVLFPLFSLIGFGLVATAARAGQTRQLLLVASAALLLLAAGSAAGLVLGAANIRPTDGGSLSLWYVLAVAGVLGVIGAAVHAKAREPA